MKKYLFSAAALLLGFLALPVLRANAATFQFTFGGPGVSGAVAIAYGSATDARYSSAFEITSVAGTFTDAKLGLSNVAITGLASLNRSAPETGNLLTPADFSHFDVASGNSHGFISFDNLFYPGGSPQTATSYPFHGGFLDIYGLLFSIGNGTYVNLWSNGIVQGTNFVDYGVAVVTSARQLDTIDAGVAITPEPSTWCLLATATVAILLWRRPSLLNLSA